MNDSEWAAMEEELGGGIWDLIIKCDRDILKYLP